MVVRDAICCTLMVELIAIGGSHEIFVGARLWLITNGLPLKSSNSWYTARELPMLPFAYTVNGQNCDSDHPTLPSKRVGSIHCEDPVGVMSAVPDEPLGPTVPLVAYLQTNMRKREGGRMRW